MFKPHEIIQHIKSVQEIPNSDIYCVTLRWETYKRLLCLPEPNTKTQMKFNEKEKWNLNVCVHTEINLKLHVFTLTHLCSAERTMILKKERVTRDFRIIWIHRIKFYCVQNFIFVSAFLWIFLFCVLLKLRLAMVEKSF